MPLELKVVAIVGIDASFGGLVLDGIGSNETLYVIFETRLHSRLKL